MIRFVVTIVLLLCAAPLAAQNGSAAERSVADGVFSEGQAKRGREAFLDSCAGCHTSSQFSDASFLSKWVGRSVFALYDMVSSSMPNDMPGSLGAATYTDVIAYILSIGGFPAGEQELPADEAVLSSILMQPKPGGGTPR